MGQLPRVRDAVAVGVGGPGAGGDVPGAEHGARGLVADELARGAPAADLGYEARVDGVARRVRGPDGGQHARHGVRGAEERGRAWVGEGCWDDVHVAVAGCLYAEGGAVEDAVAV